MNGRFELVAPDASVQLVAELAETVVTAAVVVVATFTLVPRVFMVPHISTKILEVPSQLKGVVKV